MQSKIVYVVDDDEQVRQSLAFVLRSAGYRPQLFESGTRFLESYGSLEIGCLVLDVRMPGIDGMELFERLVEEGCRWPIVMMTGHGDIPMAVAAIKQGALDFLEKPFNDEQLIRVISKAFDAMATKDAEAERANGAKAKVESLTRREREVLQQLVDGQSNKQMSQNLGVGVRTVEMHRQNMMTRLGVGSLSEAILMAAEAGVVPTARKVARTA
ncbi:response regulator transcription factor [Sphingosinicella sp. BN140058]|uniref:response regulator transcription factor n=1 Tax=Sphingosinicella sp. BN140058 TaxID=1892855 RepID=UPI0013EC0D9D|nr:response regulator [Sphingosinicella sp. BN140058]